VSHCDVSAILSEVQTLRAEVRAASDLRQEVLNMSTKIVRLREEVDTLRGRLTSEVLEHWPALHASTDFDTIAQSVSTLTSKKSFSKQAQALTSQPGAINIRKPRRTLVVGKSTDVRLASVATSRKVKLFVSRLNPLTSCEEVKEYARSIIHADNIVSQEIECESLTLKFEGLYASFHVSIHVDSSDFSHAVALLMNADKWSNGVFVKRYFKPKDGVPK